MNWTALFKAMRFACLPTLSILMLLFFGFFSISKTLAFISSNDTLAVVIRIVALIGEFILVYAMYTDYAKEDIIANPKLSAQGRHIGRTTYIRDAFNTMKDNDKYEVHSTELPNLIIIERKPQAD